MAGGRMQMTCLIASLVFSPEETVEHCISRFCIAERLLSRIRYRCADLLDAQRKTTSFWQQICMFYVCYLTSCSV